MNENINKFIFNGVSSADMGIIIAERPHITSPQRDIEYISVPGRSGDIINDNERFNNAEISYNVNIIADERPLNLMARKIKSWLQGRSGYFRLTDTYDLLYYRLAAYSSALDIEDKVNKIGITTITFNCKPFKYRIDGEREIALAAPTTLYNPEEWPSAPDIKKYGAGAVTLQINNNSFYVSNVDEYIEIDSELQSAFKGTTLQNSKISFATFPRLSPGANHISWVGNVSKITIKARWCCI